MTLAFRCAPRERRVGSSGRESGEPGFRMKRLVEWAPTLLDVGPSRRR
ncbi:MAG TPA: hypothetical protein VFA98_12285 [Thermoanaerobaculia bacterium]|nr:hypothetical protein [Thermoanaerobaculia bacterium]